VKSLIDLWQRVSIELGTWCHASTHFDFKTVEERVEHEGLSFLTITLPSFGSDLQKGLEQGKVDSDLFLGFKRKGGLPLFLGGFLRRVFDPGSGVLLDDPDEDSIFAIRQLTLMFAKISLPCSDARERSAFSGYVKCEQEIRKSDAYRSPELIYEFERMALLLFGDLFSSIDRDIYEENLVPKHGPGATADRLRGNAKFDQFEWTERLEGVFPYGENSIPNWRYYYRLERVDFLEPGAERPVRVISVPKTLKTPRIIAIEPTCMQYMQQAVMEKIVDCIEADPDLNAIIGFSDQGPNRSMARAASIDRSLATIDLSEASDRVSNQLVRLLVKHFPHSLSALDATRSRKADVPGHGIIRLAKFASMGSALCFPVEAMVFTTIVFLGIQRAKNTSLSRKDLKSYRNRVRVYGDDIIVPSDCIPDVLRYLELFGLKVNYGKTFWNGKFRESCGGDYYNGSDVTPVRVRHCFPSSTSDVSEAISLVSLRNQLYAAGMWNTSRWLDSRISDLFGGHYPYVAVTSPVLGRHSFLGYETQKLDAELQSPRVKGFVVTSQLPDSPVSGEGALLKWFLKRGDQPFVDRDHLERSGRPRHVDIKLRWAPSY